MNGMCVVMRLLTLRVNRECFLSFLFIRPLLRFTYVSE